MTKSLSTIQKAAIVTGGNELEQKLSSETGRYAEEMLENTAEVQQLQVDSNNRWYKNNKEVSPLTVLYMADIIYNAVHGTYGEDGQLQRLLHTVNTPYIGPSGLAAAHSYHKPASKRIFEKYNIQTPRWKVIHKDEDVRSQIKEVFRTLPFPAVVKPAYGGAGKGVRYVEDFQSFESALIAAFDLADKVIIEEYIDGLHISCGIIEKFRGEEIYTLPPVQIQKDKHDLEYKNEKQTDFYRLSHRNDKLRESIQDITQKAHAMLYLDHFSRADLVASSDRAVYLLEMNAIPHLGKNSSFSHALECAGIKPKEVGEHLIRLASKTK